MIIISLFIYNINLFILKIKFILLMYIIGFILVIKEYLIIDEVDFSGI